MLIEIRKAFFINKGAELMLRSIVSKLQVNLPQARLVMAPPFGYDSYLQRGELGLYQKVWLWRYRIQWGHLGKIIPAKLRQMYGLVLDSEIDVILDASGFSYSDHMDTWNSLEAAKSIRKWKKQGTKVVFMPQAFGPFTNAKTQEAFKKVVESVDLMYARDKVSYKYITDLVGEHENIKIAPDFTSLVSGEVPGNFDAHTNRFCIIPNYRMIDKTEETTSSSYIPFLVTCARYLQTQGARPFILIHEGEKDLWLGRQVAKGLEHEINVVRETNALRIKGIIGASEGVISSRFHGLVSALSQGVPALATGWSHKYEMLFRDYDFAEGLLDINAKEEDIYNKIDWIINPQSNEEIGQRIADKAEEQKKITEKMWVKVLEVIGNGNKTNLA